MNIARLDKMAEEGGEEMEMEETTFGQDTEVVQLIMQDDAGQAILPEGQLIQVTTGEGQMHYIQVCLNVWFIVVLLNKFVLNKKIVSFYSYADAQGKNSYKCSN